MFRRLSIILLDVLAAAFILAIVLLMISLLNAPNNVYGMPGIGRIGLFPVQETGHMAVIDRMGLDNLNKGDVVVCPDNNNKLSVCSVLGFQDGAYVISGVDTVSTGTFQVGEDRVGGRVIYSVPYLGFAMAYMATGPGIALCIAIPLIIILTMLSVFIIDGVHNSSKHRKKILRKKRRRNDRYMEEGMYRNKRAAI